MSCQLQAFQAAVPVLVEGLGANGAERNEVFIDFPISSVSQKLNFTSLSLSFSFVKDPGVDAG